MRIGVIGCGRMGRPMAEAMLAAGQSVVGLDLRPAAAFDSFAPHLAPDAARFGAGLNVAVSVVRDWAETETALFGAEGLIAHAPDLTHLVISSTLSPKHVHTIRARLPETVALVDAPMSGAEVAAREARLSFMLGGAEDDIDALMPLFRAMGTTHHRLGPLGAGMTAKVMNNLVAAASLVATRRAIGWAEAAGLSRQALLAVMETSSGQTWVSRGFDRIEFAPAGYGADNSIGILAKDVAAAMDAAPEGADLALPEALIAALRGLEPLDPA